MLGEMAVGVAARAALAGGFRALLAQEPDIVRQAIEETCSQFPGVEGAEPALTKWASSPEVVSVHERLYAGERDFGGEVVESFISIGDFHLPDDDELRETAGRILSVFLSALLGGLLRGGEALPAHANRQEELHSETRAHVDMGLARMQAELPSLVAAAVAGATSEGTSRDPEHARVETQIDSARDLIKKGKVVAARSILELSKSQNDCIPPELDCRLLTNLGACALASGDIEEACAHLTQALQLEPDNPKAIANGALAARLGGDLRLAIELAYKALELSPRDSNAGAGLIEALYDAGEGQQLDEFVAAEDWIRDDRQCALTLAQVRADQKRLDEALALSRRSVDEAEDDYDAHLVLASCLLAVARTGPSEDAVGWRREAEDHATQVLKLLEETELQVRRVQALSIRAEARLSLGVPNEAMADIEAVLHIVPGDSSALHNKGMLLLETGKFTEARAALERIEDPDISVRALLPLAAACCQSGDAEAASALLRDEVSLERPTWDDIRKAELLCESEHMLGAEDSVGAILERALEQEPDDPRLLALAATHGELWGEPLDPAALLAGALGTVSDEERGEVAGRLGNLYAREERFSDAADQYEEVVGEDVSHPAATALLGSLGNSGRLREALAWARKIRERHPRSPRFAIEAEAQILGRVGDVSTAVECWAELCSRDDATSLDRSRFAQALFRYGDRSLARDTVRMVDSSGLVGEPRELVRVAQLKQILGEPDYLEDAYVARRHGMDEPSVHLRYISLFLGRDKEITVPDEVAAGCAVLLQGDSSEQWWLILDPGEESRGPNDLALGADLAQKLLKQRRGDTVTLQEGIGELSYKIADIQSKYVRAFQETASGFPTRFPGNTDLSSVPVTEDDITKFLGVVDERDRFVRGLQEMYLDGPVPFAFLCARLGRPAPDLWRACTAAGDIRIRFSTGSEWEAEKGQELLPNVDTIVLDMLALLTVYELNIAEQLQRRFDSVHVPQSVVDELRNLVIETTVGAQPNGHVGKNIDGTYGLIEMSEEEWDRHQSFARSVLALAESFLPIASYPELDMDSDDVEQLSAWVTEAGVGAIFAGGEEPESRPLLVSDDLGLANLARGLSIEAVNTQSVLRELRRADEVTDDEYSSLIAQLAVLNYRFLQVETVDILRLLEANGFITDKRTRALLSTLEGPECDQGSAVSVIADLIAAIALRGLPAQQESLLVSVLLGHLRHGRETTAALQHCRRQLEARLALAPTAHARMDDLVLLYIDIVDG